MYTGDFLASLNLGTLLIVFLVVAVGLFIFLKRRRNRHPLEGRSERNIARDLDAGRAAPRETPVK